jgi:hypothetical protein
MNPNLIPISNTKKKMEPPAAEVGGQPGMSGMPGMPGMPPPEGLPPQPGAPEQAQQAIPGAPPEQLDPNTMAGALAQTTMPTPEASAPINTQAPIPAGASSAQSPMMFKDDKQEISRWEEILNRSIERVLERQQRVVLEKVSGVKAKKALFAGTLDIESVMQKDIWDRQMEEDIKPVIASIIQDSWSTEKDLPLTKTASIKTNIDFITQVNAQMGRISEINSETKDFLSRAMFTALNVPGEEERASAFRSEVVSYFTHLLAKTCSEVAEGEARRAWNFGKSFT